MYIGYFNHKDNEKKANEINLLVFYLLINIIYIDESLLLIYMGC